VAEGKIDRLAIFMPPGSAKSTYASILYPPWFLACHLQRASPGISLGTAIPPEPPLSTSPFAYSLTAAHAGSNQPPTMVNTPHTTPDAAHARPAEIGEGGSRNGAPLSRGPPRFDRQRNVLAASHTTELATRFGRRVRNIVLEHGPILGLELSEDSAAADRWALTEACGGSEYYAAGVDTGIAGFRADLAIIDDPVRSRADAESATTRERHWEWYKSDFLPRLRPGAAIILIMTRWHEDDLAGRILAEAGRPVAVGLSSYLEKQ
jgi:hypothetical protein